MGGLGSLLNTARDALSVQAFGLNVTGQNIANTSTAMYARRSAVIQNRNLGTQSMGSVVAVGISQSRDVYIDRQYFQAAGSDSAAAQYSQELASVETLFNDLGSVGLGDSLDAMFAAFQQVAANPASATARQEVILRAEAFTSRTNEMAEGLAQQKLEMVQRAQDMARQATERAEEIAKLNQQIAFVSQSGQDASDLVDERNRKLLNLSEIVDIRIVPGRDNQLSVQTAGVMLVEGGSSRSLRVDVDDDNNLQVFATRAGGGPPDSEVTRMLSAGKLAGVVEAREKLFDVSDMFDGFVFDVATAINAQHAVGFGLDGSTGVNIFEVGATAPETARTIGVSAAIWNNPNAVAAAATLDELPGGSGNAILLGNLTSTAVTATGLSPAQAYGEIEGRIGVLGASARAESALREDIFAQAKVTRESLSGVAMDEELVNLERYQRAYQAAGKVLSTVDQLLEELMAKVGR